MVTSLLRLFIRIMKNDINKGWELGHWIFLIICIYFYKVFTLALSIIFSEISFIKVDLHRIQWFF